MDRISAHAIPGKKTVLQPEAKKRNMHGVRPHTAQSPADWSTNKAVTKALPPLFVQTNKATDIPFGHVIK